MTSGLPAITLTVPAQRVSEYEYGAAVLFDACLAWPVTVRPAQTEHVELALGDTCVFKSPAIDLAADTDPATVNVRVARYSPPDNGNEAWPSSLPGLVSESAPIPQRSESFAELDDGGTVSVPFDLVWTVFFIASGAWELRYGKRDQYQRVQGNDSWLVDHGFASHPIINYYAQALGRLIASRHTVALPKRQYQRFVSCDVDRPFDPANYDPVRFAKRLARNLGIERSFSAFRESLSVGAAVRKRGWDADPYNAFDYMLDLNEKAGNKIQFFFLAEHENPFDADYAIHEPRIKSLIAKLADAGHDVGLHGSFESQFEPGRLVTEISRLRDAANGAVAEDATIRNRQHWLRWQSATSPALTHESGIGEDWSMGFNDCSGFRRSICTPFPMYDFASKQTLALIERPLVVMECSEIGVNHTVDADWEGIEARYRACAKQCREVGGEFHLLWHNHHLLTPYHRAMYERLITA